MTLPTMQEIKQLAQPKQPKTNKTDRYVATLTGDINKLARTLHTDAIQTYNVGRGYVDFFKFLVIYYGENEIKKRGKK